VYEYVLNVADNKLQHKHILLVVLLGGGLGKQFVNGSPV